MRIVMECGQKWYRIHKWRYGWARRDLRNGSFAYGPIMFFKKGDV